MFFKSIFLLILIVLGALLTGCVTTPPSRPNNICDVFDDKSGWYEQAHDAEKRWGATIPAMMAIMYQESHFIHNARTPRTKILWIIPGPRKSNAYGYAQVKNVTWNEYQERSGNNWSRRDSFKDAIDFIGWYNAQSWLRSKIKQTDTYNLYLAYHEGHGGFNRGTYKKKTWLRAVARKVDDRAKIYASQLSRCEKRLRGSWWWPF